MKRLISSAMIVLALVLSLVPVSAFAVEPVELLDISNKIIDTTGYSFTYTAETSGTMTVTMGKCSPGWRYKVFAPDGSESIYRTKYSAGPVCDYTYPAGDWKFVFYAYTSDAGNTSGTISANITFTPGDSGEAETVKAEYAVSNETLVAGDNSVTAVKTAVTTIYTFIPTENGIYQFTAPKGALVGYWGAGTFFLSDQTADKTNVLTYTIGTGKLKEIVEGKTGTVIGTEWSTPSIMVGVSGVEGTFKLKVEKIGDYEITETPLYTYENKAYLTNFTLPEGSGLGSYVDVYTDTVHTAVYSAKDGFYHLDSADGDVLLVDFNYMDIVLSAALDSDRPVMYAYTTDEEGNAVRYDIGSAIREYEAVMDSNGYYPVTEDIILFYQVYATGAGAWMYHLTGEYNKECVWMYCCRTVTLPAGTAYPGDPNGTVPSEPEAPVYAAAVYAGDKLMASYTSLTEAAAACAQGQYVVLLTDVSENVRVDADLYLDLAGFDVTGTVTVSKGATLYGMDSTTDDYDCSDGYGTIAQVDGDYAVQFKTNVTGRILRYLAVEEAGTLSFHRFYLGLTDKSLKPSTTGVGYKAMFCGDTMVKTQLNADDAFGFSLWLDGGNAVNASAGAGKFVSGKAVTLRLDNFDVENYGQTGVNAQVYLKLASGILITSSTYNYTLRSMVETVAATLTAFTPTQITALKAMCQKYAVMSKWDIANILNWTVE